jgi:enoyl-CoA hydratase
MSDTSQAPYVGVRLERIDAHVALITLDRPDKRNAINPAMATALDAMVKQTEADPAIRAVVIASSSAVFCAGADLAEVARGNGASLRSPDGGFAGLTFAKHAKPWIAAVSGPALAGGTEIVLNCDIVLATRTATFGVPEARRGLVAGAGGVFRMARALPRNVAIELVVTGQPIDAERAWQLGLVNHLVDAQALLDRALDMARSIAANAPQAVAASLAIARVSQERTDAELRAQTAEAVNRILTTEDSREGARAFIEKRDPVWLGR